MTAFLLSLISVSRSAATPMLVAALLLCQGCPWKRMSERNYAPGFAPIREAMATQLPSESSTEPSIATGHEGDTYWGDAAFYVHANAATVCDALERPETVVNDRSVSAWSHSPLATEDEQPGVTGFVLENSVVRSIATIDFAIMWTFAASEDDEGCVGRWGLKRAPQFISTNRGWISVRVLDDELTLVEVQSELNAPRVDESIPREYLTRLAAKLTAASIPE